MTENSYQHWRLDIDDHNIAWAALDKKDASTNTLSAEVLTELDTILTALAAEPPMGLVIASAKSNGFIAGADVKEFTTLKDRDDAAALIQRGQAVMNRLAEASFPTVALIHGFCLGGGLELSLACRYRIADDGAKTKLGLPEVRLGIHPGFGGTVRLPPLVGAPAAMNLMLTGRALSARAAKRLGLVDYAVPTRRLHDAARGIIERAPEPAKAKGWKAWTNAKLVRPLLAWYLRNETGRKVRKGHYPAPFALIDLWAKHMGSPRMMEAEAESVSDLAVSETARNLVRVFFLQEHLKSLGDKNDLDLRHVHVIGGGVMGGDIAAWCACQGYRVTLQDRSHETLARVMKRAHGLFKKRLKQPRLIKAAVDRLMPDLHGRGVARADVIIEAIFENVEAKHALFREVEPRMKAGALLATNTSSIPLEVLGEALQQPNRLVGLHFFNPVAKMQLVEVVKTANTDPQVARQAAAFCRHIDRLPLPVKSAPGFLVNRVLMPYLLEAVKLVEEGQPPTVVDKAALDFGMPMGPIELADTVGLDICLHVATILSEQLNVDVPRRLQTLVKEGHLGRKSGQGFYRYYGKDKDAPAPNPDYKPPEDLTDRLMMRFFNEAMACLRESVVEDEDALDAGIIFGTGFAPFRGGPMNYMHEYGWPSAYHRLDELMVRHGVRFEPDSGWQN